MRFGKSKLRNLLFAFCFLLSGLVVGDVITSLAAPSKSIISACVDRKTGSMRYLSKGRCKKTEMSISWNVQGPVGARGADGQQGLQGPRGQTGDVGPTGAMGPQGLVGPAGADGASNGNAVLSGASSPSNGFGSNGDFYIETSTNKLYGPKSNGIWPAGVSLVGPAGTAGATGSTGPQGPAGPGVFSYVPSVVVSKVNTDADAIALSSYTPVSTVGSDIEVSMACGYETVSTPSIVAWSIAVKAPSGSKVLGQTTYRNDSAADYLYGVADGTRSRLVQSQRYLELTNGEFITLSIFGPSISPVVLQLSIDLTVSSCSASGIVQTL